MPYSFALSGNGGGHQRMYALSTALVVDPDEERSLRLAELCRARGLGCEIALDGEQALTAIDMLTVPPLLLTQLTVPKIDAFEVISYFRKRFPVGGGAQVVALSSFRDLRASAQAQQAEYGLDLLLPNELPFEFLARALIQLPGQGMPSVSASGFDFRMTPETVAAEAQRREVIARKGLERLPLRPPDPVLQQFVRGVAERCGSPIALMTLALGEKLVFPARYGIDATEIDRYTSLCNKVIEAGEPLFVPDAQNNPAFHDNGLVRAGVIRGYASAPLSLGDGPPVGTLCLINSGQPMQLELLQVRALRKAVSELGQMLGNKH